MKKLATIQGTRGAWLAWLLGCLAVSLVAGGMPAKGAATACRGGEFVRMTEPVVAVIEGPGSLEDEQLRVSDLELASLEGPLTISLGGTQFDLEKVP